MVYRMQLFDRLLGLEHSKLAVWVYDNDFAKIRWANKEALLLWKAASLDELLSRDYKDNSAATQARLDSYLRKIRAGEDVAEDWTLYPRGKPTMMTLHGSGVALDDGRTAILFQAMVKEQALDGSIVRGVEVLRHTSLMVSLLDEKGGELFHNPAVLRLFQGQTRIQDWFPTQWSEILGKVAAGERYVAELSVQTAMGERWHLVEAQAATDPMTGRKSVLVQQLDVSQRREAEALAESGSRMVSELRQALALVDKQRQEILALSAPILDVGRGTLAVPIIGQLTEERGSELLLRLLDEVSAQRARFVIIDLTGCPGLDDQGARLLLRVTRSIELLGSRAIITGVAAALAQTIVQAGVDLSQLLTLRNLRDGLEYCRKQQ